MISTSKIADILLLWHSEIDRDLPWKASRDPYRIWLSEIILQQTRVAQGLPYYEKFVTAYPTIQDLATAPQDEVMNLWQGLGYYSRARNMHHTAKVISDDYDGVFPTDYKEVLALKGIGKYTAAAIVSFAFGQRYPVVDGNVLRVISRLHGITDAIDDPKTIRKVYELSEKYISQVDPADYNQAIMDFGALHCKPKAPLCEDCPFSDVCLAYHHDLVSTIPYKAKKIKKTTRYLHYLHVTDDKGCTILKYRQGKGIWQGLYDMPMVEMDSDKKLGRDKVTATLSSDLSITSYNKLSESDTFKHVLTHQKIFAVFHRIQVKEIQELKAPYIKVKSSAVDDYAMPKLLVNYLES